MSSRRYPSVGIPAARSTCWNELDRLLTKRRIATSCRRSNSRFVRGSGRFRSQCPACHFVLWRVGRCCVIVWMLQQASQMSGLAQIIGVLMYVIALSGSAILFVVCSVYWMTLISWTAMGHRTIKEFPPVDFFEWIKTSLFIINAGGISVAPAATRLARATWAVPITIGNSFVVCALPHRPDVNAGRCVADQYLFQTDPPELDEMLWFVGQVLHHCGCTERPGCHSSYCGAMFISSPSWNFVAAIVLVVSTVVYFRAFGRLAWVINEQMVIESEEDDDQDAEQPAPPPLPDSVTD